jgi:hypothetical protein
MVRKIQGGLNLALMSGSLTACLRVGNAEAAMKILLKRVADE